MWLRVVVRGGELSGRDWNPCVGGSIPLATLSRDATRPAKSTKVSRL